MTELINKGQSDIVYEDSQFLIINLHDQTAACYYGKGTQWDTAITMKSENMFDDYKQDGPIFVVLIKNPNYVGEKYQFRFFPEFFITDEKDENDKGLTLEEMEQRYSNIKKVLEKVYVKIMTEPEKIQSFKIIKPYCTLDTMNSIYYSRNKWIVERYQFVLFNDIKFIVGVKNNPDNLVEFTTDDIDTFIDTDYTHLLFGNDFNGTVDTLPKGLTHLTFGLQFNQPIDNLPPNLKHLTFESLSLFNQRVDHLPPNLTHLTFGYWFEQPVEHLPPNLTHLTFGHFFNKRVDHLPPNLTHLTFGYCFNQPVDNLPKNLTHLTFGHFFNQPVEHLPANLTHLTFGYYFKQPVEHLPPNLTHLTFGASFNGIVNNLPKNLKHLTFGFGFNKSVDHLPSNLTHLTFGYNFNQRVDHLPANLTHLTFDSLSLFNQPLDYLPPNLTHLTFGQDFNQPLDHLPPNLTHLFVFKNYTIPLNLPEKVQVIIYTKNICGY